MPIRRVLSLSGKSLAGLEPLWAGFRRRTLVCFPPPLFYARATLPASSLSGAECGTLQISDPAPVMPGMERS
jgi:hypothetical protein